MPEPESRPAPGHTLDAGGLALVLACCFLWGGNAVAVKFAVPALPPFGCAGLRFLIALPLLALVCKGSGKPLWVSRGNYGLLLFHALITVAQIASFNWGTGRSLAGRASVFINVHPLIVAPLAWLLLGERLGPRGLAGLASATMGVIVLLTPSFSAGGPADGDWLGDLAVIGSGLIFGAQTVAQKLTFPRIAPATLLFAQSLLALPIFLGYSMLFEGPGSYHFTRESVGGLLYQGLMASGLCYTLWFALLRRYPASALATVAFVTPIIGVALSTLVKGEPMTWPLLGGGVFVGLGVYLAATGKAPAARPSAAPEPVPAAGVVAGAARSL